MASSTISSAVDDLKDGRVPSCLYWTTDQVADWIEELGFPYYRSCILTNLVDGRKLIHLEAKALPSIGITDFEHIKTITKSIRDLLGIEEPDWNRSISLAPRSDLGMYLELKSGTGKSSDSLTYHSFMLNNSEAKWKPPLANHCLILPQY